jgi:stage II sporulation protein D
MMNPPPTAPHPRRERRRPRRRLRLPLAGVCAALLLLAAASPAAAYNSATQFTISGHGWGHGIGMSQWGAYGYAKHGWTYKAILKHYYTGIAFGQAPNTLIRVRLRSGLSAVRLKCLQAYSAVGTAAPLEIPAGVTATVTYVDGKYHVVAGDLSKDFSAPVTFTPSSGNLRLVTKTDLGDDGPFRGTIRVIHTTGGLMMIEKLPLEMYLRGVVPHEVSASWPAESLKAQACAARAYAVRSLNPGDPYDVYCTGTYDQAYGGAGIEQPETNAAVKATAGVVPTYNGDVIIAFYSSSSGGHTENIEYAWETSALPYLKGVDDPYDTYATFHDWGPLERSGSSVDSALGGFVQGTLRTVYTVKRGTSPRIVKAAIVGSKGTTFVHGSIIRAKLGLNSAWANITSMSVNPRAADKVTVAAGTQLTLRGRIYPALASDATVTLHFYYGGSWHTRAVTTTRAAEDLGSGYTARYSLYTTTITPAQTTRYYFSHAKASSPETTVTVTPAPSSAPSPAPSHSP